MSKNTNYQHWKLQTDAENVLWLTFDKKDASANTLNAEVLKEFEEIIDSIGTQYSGLIIKSGKSSGFIAGADIEQFTHLTNVDEAFSLIRHGQLILDKLENLSIPTVAMIEGFCLGGGLELALACRYRVAEEGAKTRLGLPEVKLGIQPGWGGTVRLPKLIGALKAMDLILSGRTVSGKAAKKMGFVDASVPKRQLERAAKFYVENKPEPHQASRLEKLSNHQLIRPVLAKMLTKKVAAKASRAHYPAPYAVIDKWLKLGPNHPNAMETEAKSIAQLMATETAQNLIKVFFLQEKLKGLAKGISFKPKRVHVIGAGTMGGDIAAWCALRGFQVTLQDREPKFIAPAIKRAYKLYKKILKEDRLVQQAMDRLLPDVEGRGVPYADVIIEAIFENLEVKRELFKKLEQEAKPEAVLATNTSSIPLDEINTALKKPERLVGIHFFNPVSMMPLVEVVCGNKTEAKTVDNAVAFVKAIDRLPLPVRSSPGFLVNRVLMPYLIEAMALLEEGVPGPVIDKAARDFGMPMGPIELSDSIGLDVCLSVADNLVKYYGGSVSERLIHMVNQGQLGRKSGKGFYEYKNDKPVKKVVPKNSKKNSDVQDRLIYRMLNEAVACLREGVVADEGLLDAGMIFGTGFAPFRGGLMNYVHHQGDEKVSARMAELEKIYGERFKPDAHWKKSLTQEQPKEKRVEKIAISGDEQIAVKKSEKSASSL